MLVKLTPREREKRKELREKGKREKEKGRRLECLNDLYEGFAD